MPPQKPLIDLAKLDRDRGAQLAALDGLAVRLRSGISRDGYSVAVQLLVSLMRTFDSLTSHQRPCTWHGIEYWSKMTGISQKQCGRAISVLKSLGLIKADVTWVAFGKRGMKIRIVWETVFTSGPITQDAEDVALWTARKMRQRNLFRRTAKPALTKMSFSETDTMSVSEKDTMSLSETDTMSVSSIRDPQIDPLNHSQQEADGKGPMAKGQDEWVCDDSDFETTETRSHGDESCVKTAMERATTPYSTLTKTNASWNAPTAMATDGISLAEPLARTVMELAGSNIASLSVPPCLRGSSSGHLPSASRHEPLPMPTRAAAPSDLIRKLVSLNVANARAAIGKSQDAGYSFERMRAILDWYEGQALVDEAGNRVFPYGPGQLVMRLRDADAIDAEPAQGNWQGGKSGFWTALESKLPANPQKQARPATLTARDASQVSKTIYRSLLTLQEIFDLLDTRNAPPLVRESARRAIEGAPLPKTLARWMKSEGLAVEEANGESTIANCQREAR